MNRLFKAVALVCALVVGFTSCSKDDVEKKLSDATATNSTATIQVPSGAKVYYDFKTNSTQEKDKGMISLSGMYGSTLENNLPGNYKMGYFDKENVSIEKLTLSMILSSDIKAANKLGIDASSAPGASPSTDPTWIIYDFKNNHAVYPTANRYIVMYKGEKPNDSADELYIIQAAGITALKGDATYNLNVKKFTK